MPRINEIDSQKIERFAFMYEFRFIVRFDERNTFVSVYKNHIIKIDEDNVITHMDCQTRHYDINDIDLVLDNDFPGMKELVEQNIDKNFNKKRMKFSIYMLSNKAKLDTFKYVFVYKEFATRKLDAIRKQASD